MLRLFFFFAILFSMPLQAAGYFFDSKDVRQFRGVPYADSNGIVIASRLLSIPGSPVAYNPSVIAYNEGFLLAFRHDTPWNKKNIPRVKIGLAEFDRFWNFRGEGIAFLNTGHPNAEDPRLFSANNQYYASYTKVLSIYDPVSAHIAVTQFDPASKQTIKNVSLNYSTGPVEKNWTPLTFTSAESGVDEVYFLYQYAPARLLKLTLPLDGTLVHVYESNRPSRLFEWQRKWGVIRGGTPAIRLDDEYVSIFHSSFASDGFRYYVMGAITFEAEPPFRFKKISQHPIIFRTIYEMPLSEDHWLYPRPYLKVIFPAGIAAGTVDDGREVLYVVAGENDTAIRLITLDKGALLSSLVPVYQ